MYRIITLVIFAFVVSIHAHAVLRYPAPFNTNPTTQGPCGVSSLSDAMKSNAAAAWRPGQTVTLVWNLVASDGGGNLLGFFDPLGGTDFTVPAWTTEFPTSGSNKFYNRTFIVPADLNCDRSPTKLCTMRVYTTSNWNSCTMINITTGAAPPPPPKVCAPITQPLSFCPNNISGASMAGGYSPADIDKELASIYTMNLANPAVFATPDSKDCKPLYKNLLCGLSLPSCDPKTGVVDSNRVACKSLCQKTMKACSVTEVHKSLYDCDSLPNCNGESNKKKGGMSSGGAAALSIFIIALTATLVVFGYIYYKKGNLFGYAYDKDNHKIVKIQSNPHNYTAYVDSDL